MGRATLNVYDHEIVDVVVDEYHRRKGIASALVGMAETIAMRMGLPRVFATVDQRNEASKGIWEKLGYGVPYLKYEKKL